MASHRRIRLLRKPFPVITTIFNDPRKRDMDLTLQNNDQRPDSMKGEQGQDDIDDAKK